MARRAKAAAGGAAAAAAATTTAATTAKTKTTHLLDHFEKKLFRAEKRKHEVSLKDITAVTKDIGIFFETAPDKVTLIRKEYFDDGNFLKSSTTNDLFRTHFISLRQNEYLADQLVKAFQKAGYKIEKGYWYD